MVIAQLYAGDGSTKLFAFNTIDRISGFDINSRAITLQEFPSSTRPWAFDGKSREETFGIEAVLLPTTYNSSDPGTGTFLDQLADLFYCYRSQGTIVRTISPSSSPYLILSMAFHSSTAVNASHTSAKISPVADTGFTASSSVYTITCLITSVKLLEIDNVQKHCRVYVEFKRVQKVVAYG